MIGDILLTTFISIVFIFIIHSLYEYFKEILTVPKVKDLVYSPANQYKEIYNTIERNERSERNHLEQNRNSNESIINSNSDNGIMKDELKKYLNTLSTKKGITPSSRSTSPVSAVTLQSRTNTPWSNMIEIDDNVPLPTFVDMS